MTSLGLLQQHPVSTFLLLKHGHRSSPSETFKMKIHRKAPLSLRLPGLGVLGDSGEGMSYMWSSTVA